METINKNIEIRAEEDEIQHSPGALNETSTGQFRTIDENIVELPIQSIQPCPRIPDYREPTDSILPIVVLSPAGCHCINGWNLVEQAQSEGRSHIRCRVFQVEHHSETELAIRKVAIRIKSQGGSCSYAELVRNTRMLMQIIMDARENPVVFSHGGTRRGTGYSNNREDDIREIMAERLGKSRTTINTYINHGRHLNDQAFDALIEARAGKDYFEKAQTNKRNWVKNFESENTDQEDIITMISGKMLDWHEEHCDTGKIETDFGCEEESGELENPDEVRAVVRTRTANGQGPVIFRSRTSSENTEIPAPQTEDGVKTEYRAIVEAVTNLLNQEPLNVDQAIQVTGDEVVRLAKTRQMLIDIRDRGENQQGEAA